MDSTSLVRDWLALYKTSYFPLDVEMASTISHGCEACRVNSKREREDGSVRGSGNNGVEERKKKKKV